MDADRNEQNVKLILYRSNEYRESTQRIEHRESALETVENTLTVHRAAQRKYKERAQRPR